VGGKLYLKRTIHEVPDEFGKNEKNFKLMEKPSSEPIPVEGAVCPDCGKKCKSPFGLMSHQKVHNKQGG